MIRRHGDLVAVVGAAVVLTIVIVALPGAVPLRVLLGLPFVLFAPGYTLLAVLYPGNMDLEPVERLAFSLGLSVAVVPLVGLGLNYLPWGIRLAPIVVTLDLYVSVLAALAAYRREHLAPGAAFALPFARPLTTWRTSAALDRLLTIALALAVVGLLVAIVVAATRPSGERFTEFYLLDPEGRAANYPRQVAPGQPLRVIVGVTNREGAAADYRITVQASGGQPTDIGQFMLPASKTWQQTVTFAAGSAPGDETVEFLLFKGSAAEPYRRLHLTLAVGQTPTPAAAGRGTRPRRGVAA